jgi:hypothetical protein
LSGFNTVFVLVTVVVVVLVFLVLCGGTPKAMGGAADSFFCWGRGVFIWQGSTSLVMLARATWLIKKKTTPAPLKKSNKVD